jgi:hypothetical protein
LRSVASKHVRLFIIVLAADPDTNGACLMGTVDGADICCYAYLLLTKSNLLVSCDACLLLCSAAEPAVGRSPGPHWHPRDPNGRRHLRRTAGQLWQCSRWPRLRRCRRAWRARRAWCPGCSTWQWQGWPRRRPWRRSATPRRGRRVLHPAWDLNRVRAHADWQRRSQRPRDGYCWWGVELRAGRQLTTCGEQCGGRGCWWCRRLRRPG